MDESLDLYEDWDFWIQASMFSDFLFIGGWSAIYRISQQSGFGVNFDPKVAERASLILFKKWFPRLDDEKLLQLTHAIRFIRIKDQLLDKNTQEITSLQQEITSLQNELIVSKDQLILIFNSYSWRITKPLRSIRRLLTNLSSDEFKSTAHYLARRFWLKIPISYKQKTRYKRWLFTNFPLLFKRTQAYQNWLSFEGHTDINPTAPTMQFQSKLQRNSSSTYEDAYQSKLEAAQSKLPSSYIPLSNDSTDLYQ